MRSLRTTSIHLFFLIFSYMLCFEAQAAAITNLSDQPQIIEVPCRCDSPQVTIAPGETWRLSGKVKIRYHEREFFIGEADEYAIWSSGDFGPQRYHNSGNGHRTR